jgi:hypothetical protein
MLGIATLITGMHNTIGLRVERAVLICPIVFILDKDEAENPVIQGNRKIPSSTGRVDFLDRSPRRYWKVDTSRGMVINLKHDE